VPKLNALPNVAETGRGAVLSTGAVQRLSGKAALRRLVLAGDSVVIDLGSSRRLLSAP
jgi:hypothetical protein